VDFDAVESDLHRVACGLLECLDDAWNFACFQRARRLVGHDLAVGGHGPQLLRNRDRRRRHRQHAARLKRRVRDAADMPELQEDRPALGVDRIDDLAPTLDLLLGIDAGHAGAAKAGRDHRRSLGDDQAARRGALRVVLRIQRPRRERRFCRAHPRQRRHRQAVLELIGTDLER
jgi:hypothetical protein